MRSLRITTAASLLLMAVAAPFAFAVGDSNTDTGFGSAASRGPYGFSNNNDRMYDTPANNYGVFRDASGALRDHGMIPDNLFTRVPEQTWAQAHKDDYLVPGGGAPGGLGGGIGYGGLGGGLGLGGLGGGIGLGGLGAVGGLGGVGLGVGGIGAARGVGAAGFGGGGGGAFATGGYARPGFGGIGGGAYSAGLGVSGALGGLGGSQLANLVQTSRGSSLGGQTGGLGNFLGVGSNFLSNYPVNVVNQPVGSGNRLTMTQNTPYGRVSETTFIQPDPAKPGNSQVTRTFSMGGQTYTQQSSLLTSSLPTDAQLQQNYQTSVYPRNSGVTNPFLGGVGNGFSTGLGGAAGFSTGLGVGTGTISGASLSNPYFSSNSTGTVGGGFSTPATSGSQVSALYNTNSNNTGLGYGLGGGIAAGFGNRAAQEDLASQNVVQDDDIKSDGSLSGRTRGANYDGSGAVYGMNGAVNGGSSYGGNGFSNGTTNGTGFSGSAGGPGAITSNFGGAGLAGGGGGYRAGVFGPLTVGGGLPVGTMGARSAVGPTPISGEFGNPGYQRIYTRDGRIPDFFDQMKLPHYVQKKIDQHRISTRSGVISSGTNSSTRSKSTNSTVSNVTTKPFGLSELNAAQVPDSIGRITGAMNYSNGDIVAFGSDGTLRLHADNSGTITLKNGDVLPFNRATPAIRAIASSSKSFM